MVVSARTTAFGELEIRTPYSDRTQLLIDDLKEQIPARFRRWDSEEKVWRILGAFAPTAVAVLLTYYPNAETPNDRPRRRPPMPARTETPASPRPRPVPSAAADQAPQDPLVAVIACPSCGARLAQPIRATVASSERIARSETPPAEFVLACPGCQRVLVIGFAPALAAIAWPKS
jgi:hypothetical protein